MGFIETGKYYKQGRYHNNGRPTKYGGNNKRRKVKKVIKERRKTELWDLPQEVIFQIFICTGLKGNNLPFVNKYFYHLINFRNFGVLHLVKLIDYQFTHNLNGKFMNLIPYIDQLITTIKQKKVTTNHLNDFETTYNQFLQESKALDISFFNYKLPVLFEHYNNHNIARIDNINLEIDNRSKYVRAKVKLLNEDLINYSKQTEKTFDDLCNMAESLFNGEDITTTSDTYTSSLPQPIFPSKFENIYSKEQMNFILTLKHHFQFKFKRLDTVILNILDNSLPPNIKSEIIEDLIQHSKTNVSDSTLIIAFKRYAESNLNPDLMKICNRLLSVFYEFNTNDKQLWEFIYNSENVPLLDLMNEFSTPVIN